jgi:hypothetical protein
MKLYKDTNNKIFGYELDGSQDHLIPSDFVALTQAEIDAREAIFAEERAQGEATRQAQANKKASAIAKLTVLGLTQDEITALIG